MTRGARPAPNDGRPLPGQDDWSGSRRCRFEVEIQRSGDRRYAPGEDGEAHQRHLLGELIDGGVTGGEHRDGSLAVDRLPQGVLPARSGRDRDCGHHRASSSSRSSQPTPPVPLSPKTMYEVHLIRARSITPCAAVERPEDDESPGLRPGLSCFRWWRGQDLNLRPSGYEPDELPDCSTPRRAEQSSSDVRRSQFGFRGSCAETERRPAGPTAWPGAWSYVGGEVVVGAVVVGASLVVDVDAGAAVEGGAVVAGTVGLPSAAAAWLTSCLASSTFFA